MQPAPLPQVRVARLAPGQLVAGLDQRLPQDVVAGLHHVVVSASSHHGPAGSVSSWLTTANHRSPPSGQVRWRRSSWKVSSSSVRHTTLKYAAAALSAGWVKSQSRSRSWALR